jgi:pyrroline-5-carboxylate reductase
MNIGVIGCGNMASPIVKTIAVNDRSIKFYTYTPSKTRAKKLANDVGGVFIEELNSFPEMDSWIIACKPQQLKTLGEELSGKLKDQKVISILASTGFKLIEKYLDNKNIIRIMPNTPSAFGQGISLMMSSEAVTEQFDDQVFKLFSHCGEVIKTSSEKQFDELTVFSGSGPAYVFRFALGYYKKLLNMGIDETVSRKLIDQLFVGSSELMLRETESYESMVDKVTSKGGVTIEAIKLLESEDLDNMIDKSIEAAIERGKQISQNNN